MTKVTLGKKTKQTPSKQRINPFTTAISKTIEDFQNFFSNPTFPNKDFEELTISPSIDIVNDKDHFKIEAELPGLGETDIDVSIHEGILTITGEKSTSKLDKDKSYLMREISYGRYERNILLPDSVDASKAKASFKKGMLWIDIPKKAEALKQNKKLKIEKIG